MDEMERSPFPSPVPRPDVGGRGPEMAPPEDLLFASSQAAGYKTEGSREISRFIEAMDSGDIGRIRSEVENAAMYAEGFYLGANAERYNLNDRNMFTDVKDKFTSVGNSADRRDHTMLVRHIRDRITDTVKDIDDYVFDRERWESEKRREIEVQRRYEARAKRIGISDDDLEALVDMGVELERQKLERLKDNKDVLVGLGLHIGARQEFDELFKLRQRAATSAETHIAILLNPTDREGNPITIENGDWIAVYQANTQKGVDGQNIVSEFGSKVSNLEKLIIDKGLADRNLYVDGILDDAEFKRWMEDLLPHTAINGKQRMDVLWTAWKMCLTKEEISRIAWTVNKDGKYDFSNNPVFMSDTGKTLQHSAKAQADEFGMNALLNENEIVDLDAMQVLSRRDNLRFVRNMTEADIEAYFKRQTADQKTEPGLHKLSHSGHPILIARGWGRLGQAYQHRTAIEGWTRPDGTKATGKVSLYEVWHDHGVNFADPRFPWVNTDRAVGDVGEDKVPFGSLSGWALELKRGLSTRGNFVMKLPQPQELGRGWYEGIRDISKVKKIQPDHDFKAGKIKDGVFPKNPMVSLAAAYLYYLGQDDQDVYKGDVRGFKFHGFGGRLASYMPNQQSQGPSDGDFVANLFDFGLVSKGEAEFLLMNFTKHRNKIAEFWKKHEKPGPQPAN